MIFDDLKVTVGIVTRNRQANLDKALRSVFMQHYRPLEIIVVDNASEPSMIPPEVPNGIDLSWIRYEKNLGPVVARNYMMTKARGQYFISLDDDAFFTDRHDLEKSVAFLEAHEEIAVLTFRVIDPEKPLINFPDPIPVSSFQEGLHILRRAVLDKTGLYREILSYGADGLDLSYRMWEAGYQVYYFPKVTVVHERTEQGRSWGSRHQWILFLHRNSYIVDWLNLPFPWVIFFSLRHVLGSIRFNVHNRTSYFALKALLSAIKEFRYIMRERKPVSRKTINTLIQLKHNRLY